MDQVACSQTCFCTYHTSVADDVQTKVNISSAITSKNIIFSSGLSYVAVTSKSKSK